MSRIQPVDDGVWTDTGRSFRHICCDCGLAHEVTIRRYQGRYQMKFIRNARSTANVRRQMKGDRT